MKYVKKAITLSLLLLMAFSLLTGCGGGSTDTSTQAASTDDKIAPIRLSSTSGFAAGHSFQRGGMDPVLDAITKKTGGAVTWDRFIGGELMPIGKELDGVLTDQVDLGWSNSPMYDPARYPLCDVLYLPVLKADMKNVMQAYKELFESTEPIGDTGKTFYQYEFGDKGLVAWLGTTTLEMAIVTTGAELNTPADFNSAVKLRTGSRASSLMMSYAGLSPITIQLAEVSDAMNRGMVNGCFISANWCDYGFETLIKYCLRGFPASAFGAPIMKKEVFDSLPEAVQTAFNEAFEENYMAFYEFIKSEDEWQFDKIEELGARIVKVTDLSPEAYAVFENAMIKTWTSWIEATEKNGHPGKAMAIRWADMLTKNGVELPETLLQNIQAY